VHIIENKGNVGMCTTSLQTELDVERTIHAHAFDTGDIIFSKDDERLWRMFENEQGLYLRSLKLVKPQGDFGKKI